MSMSKFIFVTGGVTSSLGKGIIAASLAKLLQAIIPLPNDEGTPPVTKMNFDMDIFFPFNTTLSALRASDSLVKGEVHHRLPIERKAEA